ncbi:hypothetical protein Zmor_016858 [Zophobas morio]|uniref:Uncharacterized protein n=1 Tax=Zophobas morio TaxID=2755281 RepID=A0AA38I831_9CUCU|nr:hypothetical protein Zmor_016858 [Zophobas morio]
MRLDTKFQAAPRQCVVKSGVKRILGWRFRFSDIILAFVVNLRRMQQEGALKFLYYFNFGYIKSWLPFLFVHLPEEGCADVVIFSYIFRGLGGRRA